MIVDCRLQIADWGLRIRDWRLGIAPFHFVTLSPCHLVTYGGNMIEPMAQPRTIKTWPLNWALIRYRPWSFAVHSVLLILFMLAPVGLGLVAQAVFDTITGDAPATLGVWALVALYISIGLAQ